MGAVIRFVLGWLITSNRWAIPFIVLGIAGMAVGTKAEVPKWLIRVVLWWGGDDLKKAVKSLAKQLGCVPAPPMGARCPAKRLG